MRAGIGSPLSSSFTSSLPCSLCPKCACHAWQFRQRSRRSDTHTVLKAAETGDGWPTAAELDAAVSAEAGGESYHANDGLTNDHTSGQTQVQEVDQSLSCEVSAPPSPQHHPASLMASPLTDPAGFVWSMALLVAIRLSRRNSEMSPFTTGYQV